jgi:hypothetical protein
VPSVTGLLVDEPFCSAPKGIATYPCYDDDAEQEYTSSQLSPGEFGPG